MNQVTLTKDGNPVFHFRDHHYLLDVEGSYLYGLSPQTAALAVGDPVPGSLKDRVLAKLAWRRIRKRLTSLTATEKNQELERLSDPDQGLVGLWLGVAHSCNLACRYCFANEPAYLGQNVLMTKDVAMRALDLLFQRCGERSSLNVTFFGGEPLLNLPVIEAVVQRCREHQKASGKHIGFTMTTNGTLLTRNTFDKLRSWGIRPMISMDGTQELHDSQRPFRNGKPSWETIARNLREIGPEVGKLAVRATVPNGDTDLVACLNTLKDFGFSEVLLCGLCPNSGMPTEGPDFELEAWKKRYLELMDHILETTTRAEEIPEGSMRSDVLSLKNRKRSYYCCGTGRYYLYVTPTGDIYPCFRLMTPDGSERLGHLDQPLAPDRIAPFRETNVLSTQCHDCWARYLCGGPCFGDAFFTFGDYSTPHAQSCERKKFRLQCAAYVLDMLNQKEQ